MLNISCCFRHFLSTLAVFQIIAFVVNGLNLSNCSSESRCKCTVINDNNIRATCTYLSLTEFPIFKDTVTEIDMSHNDIHALTIDTVLPPGIRRLQISHCYLQSVDEGFIHQARYLEYLDISNNRELTLEVLPNITYDLQFTSIKVFKFNALQCKFGDGVTLRRKHLYHLRNTSLVSMFLSGNRIETVERNVISNFPETLENITASDNRLILNWNGIEVSTLKSIKYIDISGQYKTSEKYLNYFTFACDDTRRGATDIDNDQYLMYPQIQQGQ